MRFVVLALALLPAAAHAGENDLAKIRSHLALPARPATACQNARADLAVQRDQPVRIRNLGQEPLAGQYLGVVRTEDGCDKPIKSASDIGTIQR
ncbi:hypothetical protein [Sphingomonas sp. KR3-1]|uniref:hypothetical protein n=1 Tax=Sphingomonas sp. KR3-1 TaxID=3156611 RepID=UPI0032B3378A